MVSCCVPYCKSTHGKTAGVSFHEFPCSKVCEITGLNFHKEWLRRISRKDFTPNLNSNSSRVCSLHFTNDDFVVGLKRRRLKTGSIPTIFPNYPQHNLPQTSLISVKRRKIEMKKTDTSTTKQRNALEKIIRTASATPNPTNFDKESQSEDEERKIEVKTDTSTTKQRHTPEKIIESASATSNPKNCDKKSQSNIELSWFAEEYKKKEALRSKNYRLQQKIKKLEEDLQKSEEKLECFTKCGYHQILEEIKNGTCEKDYERADFILEQMRNYEMKVPHWSAEFLKVCVAWRYYSQEAYSFIRSQNILKLPSKSTLNRFMDETGM